MPRSHNLVLHSPGTSIARLALTGIWVQNSFAKSKKLMKVPASALTLFVYIYIKLTQFLNMEIPK